MEISLQLNCCRGQVVIPVRLLMRQHGDLTFATILARLRCQRCKGPPAPVFLCAGGREYTGGAPPDCAICVGAMATIIDAGFKDSVVLRQV